MCLSFVVDASIMKKNISSVLKRKKSHNDTFGLLDFSRNTCLCKLFYHKCNLQLPLLSFILLF